MKKLILCSLFTSLVATNIYAEEAAETQPLATPAPITAAPAETAAPAMPAKATPAVDCNYKIPAKTVLIEQPLLFTWVKNATLQSFNFEAATLDKQMTDLKNCYTDQGWQGFNDALQKSGNLESIKTQQLSVTSQLDGEPALVETKNNQWKLSLPIQVTYQNSKDKITQNLNVALTIGRKPSGDLGIMQLIAMPRDTASTTMPAAEIKPAAPAPAPETAPAETRTP